MADATGRADQPWAARQQERRNSYDRNLLAIARNAHPRILWWWGQRIGEHGREAVCHLCGEVVATWASQWPMPRAAVRAVMEHRSLHIRTTLGADQEVQKNG